MSSARLRLAGISAWYGSNQVLADIELTVEPGTVLALMGPPNAGKSTVLKIANRLAELDPSFKVDGRVLLDGQDTAEVDPTALRRQVGMVFERPTAFPRSVADNVAFGLVLAGIGPGERARRVEQALRKVGLWDEIPDRSVSADSLGAGQRQLLCIARALALQPRALLLDEPTRWLHPADATRVESVVRSLRGQVTVLISAVDASQAGRVADTVALLDQGRLVEQGPTGDIFTNPREPATQAYLSRRFR